MITYNNHHKLTVIELPFKMIFFDMCDWFVDNKLSIHLVEETNCILSSKKEMQKIEKLSSRVEIKQYNSVEYLGSIPDQNLTGEYGAKKNYY